MADGPEKKIEDKVCAYAKTRGFLVYKFTSPGRVSVPDRMFVIPGGKVFFCEFKAPGKKPTPKQAMEHTRLREQGSIVYVVDDVAYGKLVIDRMWLDAEQVPGQVLPVSPTLSTSGGLGGRPRIQDWEDVQD